MSEEMTYRKAMDEMEALLNDMEQPDIDVELLSEKVRRVGVLLAFCKEKLSKSESEIEKILATIEK